MLKKKNVAYENIETLISEGVEIKGDITAQGSIRVDGNVSGKLNIKGDMVLGAKGKVKGEVTAQNLIIAGLIEGNVIIRERFEISATGRMNGDVQCNIITIEEGGILDGTSKMGSKQEAKTKGNPRES